MRLNEKSFFPSSFSSLSKKTKKVRKRIKTEETLNSLKGNNQKQLWLTTTTTTTTTAAVTKEHLKTVILADLLACVCTSKRMTKNHFQNPNEKEEQKNEAGLRLRIF